MVERKCRRRGTRVAGRRARRRPPSTADAVVLDAGDPAVELDRAAARARSRSAGRLPHLPGPEPRVLELSIRVLILALAAA